MREKFTTEKVGNVFLFSFLLLTTGCLTPAVRYSSTGPAQTQKLRTAQESAQPDKLQQVVESYLGTPYRYGEKSRSGIDCSGFVSTVFRKVYDLQLPHSSKKIREYGVRVSLRRARPGDLVFFRGGYLRRINHVGIYMGEGRFIHASSSRGVIYSELEEEYYKRRFAEIRRVNP